MERDGIEENTEATTTTVDGLKELLGRLGAGEDLERVREDFVRDFADVPASAIAEAEQALMAEGVAPSEIQRLCDVHSALFTQGGGCSALSVDLEAMERAAAAAADEAGAETRAGEKGQDPDPLAQLHPGHPLSLLMRENEAIVALMGSIRALLDGRDGDDDHRDQIAALLGELMGVRTHYRRKEELLMPLLASHGYPGPGQVMWGVDDEIVQDLSRVARTWAQGSSRSLERRLDEVLASMDEMVAKERRILFPLALEHLDEDEWYGCYGDLGEFRDTLGVERLPWDEGEAWLREQRAKWEGLSDALIRTDQGELTVGQLRALGELLPVDVTFIDADDVNRFYLNAGRFFARPRMTLGMPMDRCHPPRILPMAKNLIASFKEGRRDSQDIWIRNPENPVRVRYMAVRDDQGRYLGTLEVVQEFGEVMDELRPLMAAPRP